MIPCGRFFKKKTSRRRKSPEKISVFSTHRRPTFERERTVSHPVEPFPFIIFHYLAATGGRTGGPRLSYANIRDMAHSHSHDHPRTLDHLNRAFMIGIVLNLSFVAVEFIAGLRFDSIALISDAGHNLSDVISLVLALIAFKLAHIRPNARYTYGYKKSTVLVSLLNACLLLIAVGAILVESIRKLYDPQPVAGESIAWVAGIGIAINAFTAWLFIRDKEKDLNVKGAYLHMAADTLVSVGVVVSGLLIGRTGWYVIDPIMGIAIALIILFSTSKLLLTSLRLSLDGVPEGIDSEKISKELLDSLPEIRDIHHLHIWAISTTENALTAHVVIRSLDEMDTVKHYLRKRLSEYGIRHATLEFEQEGCLCDHPCD